MLFLDEPTIGLDVTMQRRIRDFIAEYNRRTGATVLLTSHYMADVEALCKRVVVIHHGRLLFDGDLTALVSRFYAAQDDRRRPRAGSNRTDRPGSSRATAKSSSRTSAAIKLRVRKSETAAITGRLLAEYRSTDLTVEDPPIDAVIERVFDQGAHPEAHG